MFESCLQKQASVKNLFSKCKTSEEKYQVLITLGKSQKSIPPEEKREEFLVQGCQSKMWIKSSLENEKSIFQTESDALISAGLGQLLVMIYSGESPEVVLKCPPNCIDELEIFSSLTPGRANGLYSLLTRMRQEALKQYIQLHPQA